ncbi:hypothetical protein HNO89_001998 [Sporosarcina luteola]|nr:hypothetical protein [Sporosarcina luteola]
MEKWKEAIEKQEIPKAPLENAILQGFERARHKQAKQRRWFRKRGVWTVVAAAILVFTFITSIRVSPAFANAIASIPGMSAIVNLIQDNKGLQLAIENEHYQAIGVSGETDDAKVTLEGIITDETSLVAFVTEENKTRSSNRYFTNFRILDKTGHELSNALSVTWNMSDDRNSTAAVEVDFDGKLPEEELIFETSISDAPDEEGKETIQIPFQIELKPVKKEQYIINETVEVQGQKIHVRSITIGAIKTAIEIEFDEGNSMEIFGFEDLRLEDEKGEIWTSIQNGVTARGTDNPNVNTYYLQSNYFKESERLTLKFNKLMAMDREDAFLIIDTEKAEIIRQPKDQRFSNLAVYGPYIEIELRGEPGYHHGAFSTIMDANGKELHTMTGKISIVEDDQISLGFDLPDEEYTNPLRLPLTAYPSYINGNVSIPIK